MNAPAPIAEELLRRARLNLRQTLRKGGKAKTVWPSGLRRWLKAPVRKGVGSNLTAVTFTHAAAARTPFNILHSPRQNTTPDWPEMG